ncbi:hypothetical protein [Nitratireductor sp. GCM10026969]|uniref:hypothetical protein n=1 Tax=Nitratireductor sp. GCM10026969 TaxID=3252645 RepID=UPI003617B095
MTISTTKQVVASSTKYPLIKFDPNSWLMLWTGWYVGPNSPVPSGSAEAAAAKLHKLAAIVPAKFATLNNSLGNIVLFL